MKCHLDYCRLQWVIREFFPLKYVFKNDLCQSRFCFIFTSCFGKGEENTEVICLRNPNDKSKTENANIQDKGGQITRTTNEATNSPQFHYHSKKIEISKIISQEDRRTTLMIKNIPNKFTKSFFLELFMKDFQGKFDLFLLPMDTKEKKNFGYGFINFIDNFHIIHFFELFNGKKWPNTNSMKICEIVYSKMQGIKKLLKHYPLKIIQAGNNNEKSKQEFDNCAQPQVRIVVPKAYISEFASQYPKAPFVLSSEYIIILSEQLPLYANK